MRLFIFLHEFNLRVKDLLVIDEYGAGFWSSAVGIQVLLCQSCREHPSVIENQNLKCVWEISQIMVVRISTISNNLKRIGKVRKLDICVRQSQRGRRFEVCLILHLRNSTGPFLVNYQPNGLTIPKHTNSFQKRNCTNRRLC